MDNHNLPPKAEPEAVDNEQQQPLDQYYISHNGTVWSPMQVMGTVRDFEGVVTKYLLGSDGGGETVEVPAPWFENNRDALRAVPGFVADASKPTLENIAASPEHDSAPAVHRQKMGNVAVELEGAMSKEDILRALPPEVQKEVSAYREAVRDKRQAEVDKDFASAGTIAQEIYMLKTGLSQQAKAFLGL